MPGIIGSLRKAGLATLAFVALGGMPACAATFLSLDTGGIAFTPIGPDPAEAEARSAPPAARDSSYSGPFAFVLLPEPTTWAMMLVGFGSIGLAVRSRGRRRAKLVSA